MEWIITIVLFVVGLIILVVALSKDESAAAGAILGIILICGGGVGIIVIDDKNNPRPTSIDVYRGRTTLEITYKDSVAIDTAVVWKDEFKPKKND